MLLAMTNHPTHHRRPTIEDLRRKERERLDATKKQEEALQARAVGCQGCGEWFPLVRCDCGRLLGRCCAGACLDSHMKEGRL